MEPRDRPTALATKTGTRDGAKPEFPGTNAMPTLTGRVKTGVPDATSSSLPGYRNSAVLVTLCAVFAHPASANNRNTVDTRRQDVLHFDALSMVPPEALNEATKNPVEAAASLGHPVMQRNYSWKGDVR